MEPNNLISSWANTIYWLGICGTLLASLLSLSRLWSSNQSSKILSITVAIANLVITLFFFFILWLTLIIVAPQENHSFKILLGWLGTGLLPSLLALSPLVSLGSLSKDNREQKKENDEELNPSKSKNLNPKIKTRTEKKDGQIHLFSDYENEN